MMSMLSKFIVAILLVVSVQSAVNTQNTLAVDVLGQGCNAGGSTKFCQDANANKDKDKMLGKGGLITTITQLIVLITGAVSVVMIIIGGLRYVLSSGDSKGVHSAKDTILYSLIGLVVAIFSQVIVSFVLSKL